MRIPSFLIAFVALFLLSCGSIPALAAPGCGYKQQVTSGPYLLEGKMAEVRVEPALYRGFIGRYFAGFRVINRGEAEIGVDFGDFFKVIYPNQWQFSSENHRQEIAEERMIPAPLKQKEANGLLSAFGHGLLARIPAHGEITFYRQFNGPDMDKLLQESGKFLLVSFDGMLNVTDGKEVETLSFGNDLSHSEAAFPLPLCWRDVPKNSIVLQNDL